MSAPVVRQHKSSSTSSGSTLSASFASATLAGNMIVAIVCANQGITMNTPTMTGETFTVWTGASHSTTSQGQVNTYAVNSAVGGQTTVTATSAGGTEIELHIFEISGAAAPIRDSQGATASTTLSVTSGSTTAPTDLLIAMFFDWNNNRTLTPTGGYTQLEQINDATAGSCSMSCFNTSSTNTTHTATASGNTTDNCEQVIIAIGGTAAPVAAPPSFYRTSSYGMRGMRGFSNIA